MLRYVQEREAASIRIVQSDANSVSLSMAWPMDQKIYDVPLTLKLEVSQAWKEAAATGDGKTLSAKIVDRTKGTVILIDVPAQTAEVRITEHH